MFPQCGKLEGDNIVLENRTKTRTKKRMDKREHCWFAFVHYLFGLRLELSFPWMIQHNSKHIKPACPVVSFSRCPAFRAGFFPSSLTLPSPTPSYNSASPHLSQKVVNRLPHLLRVPIAHKYAVNSILVAKLMSSRVLQRLYSGMRIATDR